MMTFERQKESSKLRVLQLLPSMEVGGLEVIVARLSEKLNMLGIDVSLGELTHRGGMDVDSVFQDRWVGNLRIERGVYDFGCYWRLWRYLMSRRFSVVHVHNTKSCLYLLPASFLSRTPVIYTVHGSGSEQFAYNSGMNRVHRLGTRVIHRYVAVSEDARDRLVQDAGVPVQKTSVVRNGIDLQSFGSSGSTSAEERRMSRQRFGIPEKSFVIGSVGRFSVEKNYPLLVQAFTAFARQFQERSPTLVLVGDGPDRHRIEDAIRMSGVGECCVLPGVQTDIRSWLQSMDVFCLSSDTEGTSITLLEAGACGLPCVVTEVGGNADVVVHESSGIVVPQGNAEALSQAFSRLMRNPAERDDFGQRMAQRVVAEYSMDQMVDAYLRLYRSAAGRNC